MPAPDKAAQEAESRAREQSGIDPALNAAATEVIDDSPPNDPQGETAPQRQAETQPVQTPRERVENPFISKRNEIISRFRTNRTEEADTNRDEISDFARSGMPPEFEPQVDVPVQEPEAEPAPVTAEGAEPESAAEPEPQKFKVKVRGKEMELSLEQLTAEAQKSLAGESYLEEGKSKLKEIDGLLAQHRANLSPPRAGQNGQHPAQPNVTQQTEQQPTDGTETPQPESALAKLVEAMQFGDPAEAQALLANTIAEETTRRVREELLTQRLKDEGARSNKILSDFVEQHPDLAADPRAEAVIQRNVYDLQIEDLKAIGVEPANIPTPSGIVTPADIAMAHRYYRAEGYGVRSPKDMLEKATEDFLTWKGVDKPTPAEPANKATPRVEVTVDRAARRQAIPQQPSRAAAPTRAAAPQPPPAPRDKSDIVQAMVAKRSLPRGRVLA